MFGMNLLPHPLHVTGRQNQTSRHLTDTDLTTLVKVGQTI